VVDDLWEKAIQRLAGGFALALVRPSRLFRFGETRRGDAEDVGVDDYAFALPKQRRGRRWRFAGCARDGE